MAEYWPCLYRPPSQAASRERLLGLYIFHGTTSRLFTAYAIVTGPTAYLCRLFIDFITRVDGIARRAASSADYLGLYYYFGGH